MSDLSIRSMETALSQHTRAVQQDNWQVLAGISTTQFTVSLINPAGTATHPVVPNALDGSSYVGCEIEFTTGINSGLVSGGAASSTGRVSASILSVMSGGSPLTTTITLNQALPNVPVAGDGFTIYRAPSNAAGIPQQVGSLLNEPVTANTNVLTNGLQPLVEGTYSVRALVSVATTLSVITQGNQTGTTGAAETVNGLLNSGAQLTAGAWYTFDFPCGPLEVYNFQAGADCNLSLRVQYRPS